MDKPDPASFTIFPAIDLRGGQVVRLKEGDPDRQTYYSSDPAGAARRWIDGGRALAARGQPGRRLWRKRRRQPARAERYSDPGPAGRCFGAVWRRTALAWKPSKTRWSWAFSGWCWAPSSLNSRSLEEALARWGCEHIAAGLDARDGLVQVRGWQSATTLDAGAVAASLKQAGLRWLVFTDIARDGLQTGLNLPATIALARQSGLRCDRFRRRQPPGGCPAGQRSRPGRRDRRSSPLRSLH